MNRDRFAGFRVSALALKDAHELIRNPGAIIPAVLMVLGSLFPAFLVIVITPRMMGRSLGESGEFSTQAAHAIATIPELAGLTGNALAQAFLFHQFAVLLLLVPIVAAMSLATHAVIGEKQAKALEPLLATPISTFELLAAKTLTPFAFSLALTLVSASIYLAGAAAFGDTGVFQALADVRLLLMLGLVGPLGALASLQMSVIVSSRAGDPRSAQQITALLILPVTGVFIAQLTGALVIQLWGLFLVAAGALVLNGLLMWLGIAVFDREAILTRWR